MYFVIVSSINIVNLAATRHARRLFIPAKGTIYHASTHYKHYKKRKGKEIDAARTEPNTP
jgi:hypothetical protein